VTSVSHHGLAMPIAFVAIGRSSRSETAHEVGGVDPERCGEPNDVDEADIALAPLDRTDVGAVESNHVAEALLGDADVLTHGAHALAELDGRGRASGGARHRPAIRDDLHPIRLQIISSS
jgi:hypothetical protein